MNTNAPGADALTSRMVRNTVGLAAWTGGWVASLALAAFGPAAVWNREPALTLLAIGVNVVIGIGMLLANRRNLLGMDELQRTIQLQVMAWTLGLGLVGGLAWTLFDRHDLVPFQVGIGHLVAFMSAVYMVGTILGARRYR
jgi:hypothetical protein